MKKEIVFVLASVLLASCAGRTANPIPVREVGDSKLDCDVIAYELSELDRKARRLLSEQSNKTGKNAAWGVAGLFLFPLWLGLDLSDAERQEAVALQDRYRHLDRIYNKKKCDDF